MKIVEFPAPPQVPFASNGTKTAVPLEDTVGIASQKTGVDQNSKPDAQPLAGAQFNQIISDVSTQTIRSYYSGINTEWTSEDAFARGGLFKGAIVASGPSATLSAPSQHVGRRLWRNSIDDNVSQPGVDSTTWSPLEMSLDTGISVAKNKVSANGSTIEIYPMRINMCNGEFANNLATYVDTVVPRTTITMPAGATLGIDATTSNRSHNHIAIVALSRDVGGLFNITGINAIGVMHMKNRDLFHSALSQPKPTLAPLTAASTLSDTIYWVQSPGRVPMGNVLGTHQILGVVACGLEPSTSTIEFRNDLVLLPQEYIGALPIVRRYSFAPAEANYTTAPVVGGQILSNRSVRGNAVFITLPVRLGPGGASSILVNGVVVSTFSILNEATTTDFTHSVVVPWGSTYSHIGGNATDPIVGGSLLWRILTAD